MIFGNQQNLWILNDCAAGDEHGKAVDDGVAAMAGGAVDVACGEDEGAVAGGADEEVEGGLREVHGVSLRDRRAYD